jgi:hypothetical protein
MNEVGGQRKDIVGVFSLIGVAILFALLLLITLPLLAGVDPVGPNVMRHRLKEAFCKPQVSHRFECLHECAAARGKDYKDKACEGLPKDRPPSEADQKRLEAGLFTHSPCAAECRTSWKEHDLWCRQSIEKAKQDAVDACIYEGATIALFEWKEARARRRCPDSKPDSPGYLASTDTCMLLGLAVSLIEEAKPHEVQALVTELRRTPEFVIGKLIKEQGEPPMPPGFHDLRHECRLAHVRATPNEELEQKRQKERAFADCVRQRLDGIDVP